MDDVFSTKIEKSRKNNKNLSSQIFVMRNIVNDPLNVRLFRSILFQIKRLIKLRVYTETFVKGVYKILSGAHL